MYGKNVSCLPCSCEWHGPCRRLIVRSGHEHCMVALEGLRAKGGMNGEAQSKPAVAAACCVWLPGMLKRVDGGLAG